MEKGTVKNILAALAERRFAVETTAPTGITQHHNYAGTPFLRLNGEENNSNIDAGTCTVKVENHIFVCNLNTGIWTYNGCAIKDHSLLYALNHCQGITSGEHQNGHELAILYAERNGLSSSIPYCWTDNENLKDVSELGEGEAGITVRFTVLDEGGWDEIYITIDDGLLYQLYRHLKHQHRLPDAENEIEVNDSEIEKHFYNLYDDIINQIKEEYNCEEEYHFTLPLTQATLNATLFGEITN